LQAAERREHGAHVRLLRLQREFTELGRPQRAGHGQSHGAAEVFLVRKQGLEGNLGRLLQPGQQDVAGLYTELAAEGRRDEHAVPWLEPVKPPEPIVHAIHEHPGRAPVGGLVGDEGPRGDQRHG
jgi:hypothetical protein